MTFPKPTNRIEKKKKFLSNIEQKQQIWQEIQDLKKEKALVHKDLMLSMDQLIKQYDKFRNQIPVDFGTINQKPVNQNKIIEKKGPLIGYRGWGLTSDFDLRAANAFFGKWEKGVHEAQCLKGIGMAKTHKAPTKSCKCGIYGYWEPAWSQVQGVIKGSIKVWGTIIPGEFGFRAEKAQIQSLYWPYCAVCQKSRRNVLAEYLEIDSRACLCEAHRDINISVYDNYKQTEVVLFKDIFNKLENKYECEIVKPIGLT